MSYHEPIRRDVLLPMDASPRERPWLDRACLTVGLLAFALVPGRALVTIAWRYLAG